MLSSSNKKIAQNTGMLYIRMFVIMAISVYTSRVILHTLGIADYGLNNLVGGLVGTFIFINSSLSTSVQRYLSIAIGRSDPEMFGRIFQNAIRLNFKFSLLIVLLSEVLWFLLIGKLNIPHQRLLAAYCVYNLSLFSLMLSIINSSYMAVLNAKENFSVTALINILEAILRLAIVFALVVIPYDKLVVFGILNTIISITSFVLIRFACRRYSETRMSYVKDAKLEKELMVYSSWNMFGAISIIARSQGVVVLLNIFFGVLVNAAYAVANQIKLAIEGFSMNFTKSVIPQIMQNYGSGDVDKMNTLIITSTKISFYLLFLISFPIIAEMDFFLHFWLKNPPQYSNVFSILVLVNALIDVISLPLMNGVQATGKIKMYQIVLGTLLISNFPICFIVFKLGATFYASVIVSIGISLICLIVRLFFAKSLFGFDIKKFVFNILFRGLLVVIIVYISTYFVIEFYEKGFSRFLIVLFESTITMLLSVYFLALNKFEKSFVNELVIKTYSKLKKSFD